ncbi:hypothetical protein WN55_02242 [Dufourea novaeangliae]|uniref:Uncharacterized protein n=1 Tax=Dufourea novaeangliae TaxID=178035 RepID=A0A154PFW3_DUFNO|nr:hypothetical protein WN55_02242 [Dufourea novaeangliae]
MADPPGRISAFPTIGKKKLREKLPSFPIKTRHPPPPLLGTVVLFLFRRAFCSGPVAAWRTPVREIAEGGLVSIP